MSAGVNGKHCQLEVLMPLPAWRSSPLPRTTINFQEFCRLIQPREARQRTETLARRATARLAKRRFEPKISWQQPFSLEVATLRF